MHATMIAHAREATMDEPVRYPSISLNTVSFWYPTSCKMNQAVLSRTISAISRLSDLNQYACRHVTKSVSLMLGIIGCYGIDNSKLIMIMDRIYRICYRRIKSRYRFHSHDLSYFLKTRLIIPIPPIGLYIQITKYPFQSCLIGYSIQVIE